MEETTNTNPPSLPTPDKARISALLTGANARYYNQLQKKLALQKARKTDVPLTHKEVMDCLLNYSRNNKGYSDPADAYPIG